MGKEMEREAWTKVLSLFKEMPHLYDRNHKEYLNRHMRQADFDALLQIYNEETGKDLTLAKFKKKIDNLRTTYARELKKVKASKQTGSGDVYIPTLWYYSLFDFLEGTTEPISTQIDPFEETQNCWSPELEEISPKEDPDTPTNTSWGTKKQKIKLEKKQETMLVSTRALLTQKEGDWEIIGKSIAVQMRNLSTHQQVIVQKLISDAIFYGKLGKLTDESHITLSP